MTLWFGEPWPDPDYRAGICSDDSQRTDTPVGLPCMHCQHPIEDGDQGTVYPGYVGMVDGAARWIETLLPAHKECGLRSVLGCSGLVHGREHTHERDYREDARDVWAWLQEQA